MDVLGSLIGNSARSTKKSWAMRAKGRRQEKEEGARRLSSEGDYIEGTRLVLAKKGRLSLAVVKIWVVNEQKKLKRKQEVDHGTGHDSICRSETKGRTQGEGRTCCKKAEKDRKKNRQRDVHRVEGQSRKDEVGERRETGPSVRGK